MLHVEIKVIKPFKPPSHLATWPLGFLKFRSHCRALWSVLTRKRRLKGMSRSAPFSTRGPTVPSGWYYSSFQPLIEHAMRMLSHVLCHIKPETAPSPLSMASLSRMNSTSSWGKARMGALENLCLMSRKASSHSAVYLKRSPFWEARCKGYAMWA